MPEIVIENDHQSIVAGGFRLTFRWSGDRWTHDLEHQGPRDPRPLARSFETSPEHEDPVRVVSPAFQQLSFQEVDRKVQALLVGQSGPHHFSAVFEVEERKQPRFEAWPYEEDPALIVVKVEVADRCRSAVEGLASTYRVAADSSDLSDEMLVCGPLEIAWDLGPNRLTFIAPEPAQVAFGEDGRRGTRVQATAAIPPGVSTYRWTYYWSWDPDIRFVTVD